MPAAENRGLNICIELGVRPSPWRVERCADLGGERCGGCDFAEDEAKGFAENAHLWSWDLISGRGVRSMARTEFLNGEEIGIDQW